MFQGATQRFWRRKNERRRAFFFFCFLKSLLSSPLLPPGKQLVLGELWGGGADPEHGIGHGPKRGKRRQCRCRRAHPLRCPPRTDGAFSRSPHTRRMCPRPGVLYFAAAYHHFHLSALTLGNAPQTTQSQWLNICSPVRDKIVAACDFYTYARYISQVGGNVFMLLFLLLILSPSDGSFILLTTLNFSSLS